MQPTCVIYRCKGLKMICKLMPQKPVAEGMLQSAGSTNDKPTKNNPNQYMWLKVKKNII